MGNSDDWMHYTEERPPQDMSRIDNIGQNGNDGLHYEDEIITRLYCTLQCVVDGKTIDYARARLLIEEAKLHIKGT